MYKVACVLFATLALASAGGLTGSLTSQYTQHSHAVAVSAPIAVAPVVHAAPAVVHTTNVIPNYYRAAVPTAYASTFSYRAPAARVVAVHRPVIAVAPAPVVRTVYAPTHHTYSRATLVRSAPIVHHAVPVVRTIQPVVHAVPVVRTVQPVVHTVRVAHATPIVHHAPLVHAAPIFHATPVVHHAAHPVFLH